jgi:hypothetical protein
MIGLFIFGTACSLPVLLNGSIFPKECFLFLVRVLCIVVSVSYYLCWMSEAADAKPVNNRSRT